MLHSPCQQVWKTQQWPQDWKRSIFIPIPKKSNAKECSNYHIIALISHTSKVMLKILQARLQQYVNQELPDVQAGFRKGKGTRDQIANIHWIIKTQESSRKKSISALLTTPKPLVIANTLFQQHKRRLYTWTSPDGQHRNQTDYILCRQRWRSSIQSAKTRLGADCGSDHEFLAAKFRLKLKKVGKTTRPFRYDLNQIPNNYTVEVTSRFKGLDLIECLMNYGQRFVTLYRIQGGRPSPRKRNAKQNGCLRRPYK